MTSREDRESLISKIAELQRQQLTVDQDGHRCGWTREESALVFDTRFALIASLLRQLSALDEGERS